MDSFWRYAMNKPQRSGRVGHIWRMKRGRVGHIWMINRRRKSGGESKS